MSTCELCGSKNATHESRPRTFEYKDVETTVNQPATYCDDCGESLLGNEDRKAVQRLIANFKAGVDGVLPPSEVHRIRKSVLRVNQNIAGRVLGGGPNGFSRYETGKVVVPPAISVVLEMADKNETLRIEIQDFIKEKTDEDTCLSA